MTTTRSPQILIGTGRGNEYLGSLFERPLTRRQAHVTVISAMNPDAWNRLENQAFDGMLIFCSPGNASEITAGEMDRGDWQMLEAKARSRHAVIPVVAVAVAPSQETCSRMQALGVKRVIDLADKPSAQEIVEAVLQSISQGQATPS